MSHFVFPKWTNGLIPLLGAGALVVPVYMVGLFWFGASPKTTDVGYQPDQVIPYSHRLHVGDLGIDCRYCHNTVEYAAKAAIPPTDTCMNCHASILPNNNDAAKSEGKWKLQPLLDSHRDGTPVEWTRVHDLPDYAYFNHSAHVSRGVSCVSCHGRVDKMDIVYQRESLSMGFCLECHRDPVQHIRDPEKVFDLAWTFEGDAEARALFATEAEYHQWWAKRNLIFGAVEREQLVTRDPNPLTDCSTCHR